MTDQIKEIARIAGRTRRIISSSRTLENIEGVDPTQVVITQDPVQLFPEELSLLSSFSPDIVRTQATVDFLTNGLIGWKNTGEAEEEGDFLALGDVSGSMSETQVQSMLGVMLGVALEAQAGGRAWVLGTFNHDCPVAFVRSEDGWEALMSFLNHSTGGGTSFDRALNWGMNEVLRDWAGSGRGGADCLFFTDGICYISEEIFEEWKEFNEETGTRIFYVPIVSPWFRGSIENEQLEELCDRIIMLDDFTEDTLDHFAGTLGRWVQ